METAQAAELHLQAIATTCAAARALSLQIERASKKAEVVDLTDD